MLVPVSLFVALLSLVPVSATPTTLLSINPPLPTNLVPKDLSNKVSLQTRPRFVTPRWTSSFEASSFKPKNKRRAQAAKRSTTPCSPLSFSTGYISARNTAGGPLGFISAAVNPYGEYFSFTSNINDALRLSFAPSTPAGCETGALTVLNGPYSSSYPYFALVAGFANTNNDLTSGSYNYAYLAGASATTNSFNAVTGLNQMAQYSSAWSLAPGTFELVANWENSNGIVQPSLVQLGDTLTVTGDVQALTSRFGAGTEVFYTFVPL
ncbi:hypothetical protein BDY24DRAFT_437249 [Mrakia frigida]|uniref:uncharacterized protein n=1 Tax=Mrakia frigida TaxID=29902 RepID=UPI003FCC11F3